MANTANNVKSEIRAAIVESQNRIKVRMFDHGMIKKVSETTGLSRYRIRQAVVGDNPKIETLEAIETALAKISKAA